MAPPLMQCMTIVAHTGETSCQSTAVYSFFARVVRSNAVLSKETMDAESSEVLGMREGSLGRQSLGRGGGIVNVVRVGRAVR